MTVQMPLALSLSSCSAFQVGPHFLRTALPLLCFPGPHRGSLSPLLSSTAAATEAPLGPGGRGAEKAALNPAGARDLGSESTATSWACFPGL